MNRIQRKSATGNGTSPAANKKSGRTPTNNQSIVPSNNEKLFAALMQPVFESIKAPRLDEPTKKALLHYLLPWPGYTGLEQSREILSKFEELLGADAEWQYFNGSDSSAAQMSQACDAVKAVCENATNMIDACIFRAAQDAGDLEKNADGKWVVKSEMADVLSDPKAAAEHYFGLSRDDFSDPKALAKLGAFAKSHCVARVFGGYGSDVGIIDLIDAGCGVAADDGAWGNSFLSLNRGFKALLLIAIGKWGWGAAGCYQNGDMSLIASVLPGTDDLMFTVIEKAFMRDEDRVPTFRYLTVKGKIPKIKKPSWWSDLMMPEEGYVPSTIVRHFQYHAAMTVGSGDKSIGAVLDRLLPQTVLPIWSEYVHMASGEHRKAKSLPGNRRTGRLVRGTFSKLHDSWQRKLAGTVVKKGGTPLMEVRHYDYFDIDLGDHDYTGRTGVKPAGSVRAEIWVVQPTESQTDTDALRNLINPDFCVLFHLDGQTHAEERSTLVRSGAVGRGADLAHVGRRCVVGVDCSNLTREAKYALFGSSREQMKSGELHSRLKQRVIKRLRHDQDLRRIDGEIAMERSKKLKRPDDQQFATALEKYLGKAQFKFGEIQRQMKVRVKAIEDQERDTKGKAPPPKPIPPELPPRLLRWALEKKTLKMYPGQSYSWVLETSAPQSWWDPQNLAKSPLKVLAGGGVSFTGADRFKAGRLRCHFECPASAKVGDTGFIQAQIDYPPEHQLGSLSVQLRIEVVKKKAPKTSGTKSKGTGKGKGKKVVQVEVWKDDLQKVDIPLMAPTPIPFMQYQAEWAELGWPTQASLPAFTLTVLSKEAELYYNPEFKEFLDIRAQVIKKHPGTEEKFLKEYEMKLALEAIFMLNEGTYETYDDEKSERTRVYKMNRATARNLAMDVARELDLEAQLAAEKLSE